MKKLQKKYREADGEWFDIDLKDCIDHTEGSGYWKEGSVLAMLEDGHVVHTPFADYRMIVDEERVLCNGGDQGDVA